MKSRLVESEHAARFAAIAAGEQKVVGVNCYTETAPSPLTTGEDGGFLAVDPAAEAEQVERLRGVPRGARRRRGRGRAGRAQGRCRREGRNVMPASIACAHAGVTTGEWGAGAARGVRRVPRADRRRHGARRRGRADVFAPVRDRGRGARAPARPPAQDAGRQARPRRPQQRGRADRGARARLPASRWSTRASASPRPGSPTPRWRRASTSSASRSSPARTCRW